MLSHVALVRTYVSEELSASIIRVTEIGELGMLAVTSIRRTLERNTKWAKQRLSLCGDGTEGNGEWCYGPCI
jgi:hypothetical protein